MSNPASNASSKESGGSLFRAAGLLREIAAAGSAGCTMADLVGRSGMARPTVYRVCDMLQRLNWIERDPASRRFFLGQEVATLGLAAQLRHSLESFARPYLERLSQDTGQTCYLMGRSQDEAVCLARIESRQMVRTLLLEVGARWPLGWAAAGMAILAGLPAAEADEVLARTLPRLNGQSESDVRARLAVARETGVARHEGLILPGVAGVGAAVFDASGRPIAAVSAAYVAAWIDDATQHRCIEGIRTAAKDISERLAFA